MDNENEALEPRVAYMEALFKQHPELDSLLTNYTAARIHEHLSMGRHDFSEVPFADLKKAALTSMCKRINYAEDQVGARYSDKQLFEKMHADIQHDLKALQQYGLPATRAR